MNFTKMKQTWDSNFGTQMDYLMDYYNGENCPINSRQPLSDVKADSHTNLHVDFFGSIIELKTSYLGNSIKPQVNIEDEAKKFLVEKELLKISRINSLEIMNQQSVRWTSISGLSHRLIYTDNGLIKFKNIQGSQVIYEYDQTPMQATKAYYFYSTTDIEGKTTDYLDVYDTLNVTYYKKSGTEYAVVGEPQPHNFLEVPIVPMFNNDLMFGDCEKSVDIMDLYDVIISDISGEIKSIRSTFLKVWGDLSTGVDSEGNPIPLSTYLKTTGTFRFPADEMGKSDASFLEKNLNDNAIENLLNRLRELIFETSGSIDLKEISSTERLYSAKTMLMRLSGNADTTERFMKAALYKLTRLICYWLGKYSNIVVDETEIDWIFTRNFPRDLANEATVLTQLSTVLDIEDALKMLGIEGSEEIAQRARDKVESSFNDTMNRTT